MPDRPSTSSGSTTIQATCSQPTLESFGNWPGALAAVAGRELVRYDIASGSSRTLTTIKGGSANIIKFFSSGDSHVSLVEIDGLYLPPSFWTGSIKSVTVAPGTRRLTLLLHGNNYTQAQDMIELQVLAGRTYQIEATLTGIAFDVVVYDEGTSGKERNQVLKTRITGGRGSGPAYVPVFIPVK